MTLNKVVSFLRETDLLFTFAGAFIPSSHLTHLTMISERLAAAFPTFALGVVSQIASSLTLVSAHESAAYVHCLRPWLHHLSPIFQFTPRKERDAIQLKTRRALRQLVHASVREPAVSDPPPRWTSSLT